MLFFSLSQMVGTGYLTVFLVKTALVDWGQMYLIQECGKDKITGKLIGKLDASSNSVLLADRRPRFWLRRNEWMVEWMDRQTARQKEISDGWADIPSFGDEVTHLINMNQ